jgi:hypothetical protein
MNAAGNSLQTRFASGRPLPLQAPTAFVRIRPTSARGCGESRPTAHRSCAHPRRLSRQ